MDDDAGDIGLVNPVNHFAFNPTPGSSPSRPRRPIPGHLRRTSSSLVSSSSADLEKRLLEVHLTGPRSPTGLSRSATLPRGGIKFSLTDPATLNLDAPTLSTDVVIRLRRWIHCILLVNFDLDLGPVVHGVYPPFELSSTEKENISFASFPDSSQFDEGSQSHSFRIREKPSTLQTDPREHSTTDGFLYGFARFTQRKHLAAKRGYEQRSVVILTRHSWPAIFSKLVDRLEPMYIEHGGPMLEAACHNIASWPEPRPGANIELGFLGEVLHVELPGSAGQQQLTETASFKEKFNPDLHILASMSPASPPPISLFDASLSHMWSMWECLILCEPLLVFGPSPAVTSQAIWWLLDILRPIPFAGDFRPYFTIQDNEYASLITKNTPKSGLILGVTNPFFSSTCKHWPHVLSLGREMRKQRTNSAKTPIIAGPAPGWQTKTHNRYISKDRDLLKQLEMAVKKASGADLAAASLLLRRHFSARTSAFLVPLNRYLTTLIPAPSEVTAASASSSRSSLTSQISKPCLKPFQQQQFFASLKAHGSPLPFRSAAKQREFHERWLRSPAFGLWIARQDEIVNEVLRRNAQIGS